MSVREDKVYRGDSQYSSDILYRVENSKIYRGNSTYRSDIVANRRGKYIYRGDSSYRSDVEFWIDGDVTLVEFVAIWYVVKYCW